MDAPVLQMRCVPVQQHDKVFFFFAASAKTLFDILDIDEREPDKDKGYQRALSMARVRQITDFVKHKNILSPAIVVSLQGAEVRQRYLRIEYPPIGALRVGYRWSTQTSWCRKGGRGHSASCHCLFGFRSGRASVSICHHKSNCKRRPIVSLFGISRKYLPPSKKPADVAKDKASDIAQGLRHDDLSPFHGRITVTPPQAGHSISLTNFVRKVAPLIQENKSPISSFNVLEQTRIVDNYFRGLREHEPGMFRNAPSIVFRTLGFGALLNALPFLFHLTFTHHGGFRVMDVTEVFNKINFNFSQWNNAGSGNAAELQAGNELVAQAQYAFEEDHGPGKGAIRLD